MKALLKRMDKNMAAVGRLYHVYRNARRIFPLVFRYGNGS